MEADEARVLREVAADVKRRVRRLPSDSDWRNHLGRIAGILETAASLGPPAPIPAPQKTTRHLSLVGAPD